MSSSGGKSRDLLQARSHATGYKRLPKTVRIGGLLLLLAAGLACVRLAIDPSARSLLEPPKLGSDEVTFETANQLRPVWIDARNRAAFERKHIQGAHLLTLDQNENFEQLLFEIDSENLLDGSRPVVVYCSSRSCQLSKEVAGMLRERYPGLRVFVLYGGWG